TRRAQIAGNSIRVSEHQFPGLQAILVHHCERLGVEPQPELYFSDCAVKAASSSFSAWKRDYIVLGSAFLDPDIHKMDDVLSFLIGREIGRIRLGHTSVLNDLLV